MRIFVRLWQYLAQFFLQWEMYQTKAAEKNNTHTLCSVTFSRKTCDLLDNVVKYGTAGQATNDNIIHRMRFAFLINKAANIHSECVILIAFPQQQFFTRTGLSVTLYVHWLPCLIPFHLNFTSNRSYLSEVNHNWLHLAIHTADSLALRVLMSYIYGAPILDVSRSHTTTQHSR